MNYLKEKNKMRPIWKTKRDQLFLNSTDKDKDYFLKNFISTFNELDGKVVAGYNPIGSEVNCLEILKYSFSKGALISLPFVNKKKFIEFREWKEGDDLEFDHSNTLAPSNKKYTNTRHNTNSFIMFRFERNQTWYGRGYL